MELMKGASAFEWGRLLQVEKLRSMIVGVYDHGSECIDTTKAVPWPVVWLLGTFNPGHRFCRRQLPSLDKIAQHIHEFTQKIKWKYVYRNTPKAPYLRIKYARTPVCNETVPPELNCWLWQLRQKILSTASRAVRSARHCSRKNTYPLMVDWALRILKQLDFIAIKNDKTQGFTLVRNQDNVLVDQGIMNSENYQEILPHEIQLNEAVKQYLALSVKIGKFEEDPGVARQINRSLYIDGARIVSDLLKTCKTHKVPISFRAVHASARHMFSGLSRWVARTLRGRLDCLSHLCKDARHAAEDLAGLHIGDSKLVALDIKDFFMSGDTNELVEDTILHLTGPLKGLMREALFLLLFHQYVRSKTEPGRLYRVIRGTGMGLVHSGEVSDSALYNIMETWCTNRATRQFYRVMVYKRFKDDVLLSYSDRELFFQYIDMMKRKAKYFKMKADEISVYQIHWLNLMVEKKRGALTTRPAYKPNFMALPLAGNSTHPQHVHETWPTGLLNMMLSVCSDRSTQNLKRVSQDLIKRLESTAVNPNAIRKLRARNPEVRSAIRKRTPVRTWMVLPYHPIWSSEIRKAVGEFRDSCKFLVSGRDLQQLAEVHVSWKNHLPSLATLIRNGRESSDHV